MDKITRENKSYKHLCEDDILNRHSEIFLSHLEFILLQEVIKRAISTDILHDFYLFCSIPAISSLHGIHSQPFSPSENRTLSGSLQSHQYHFIQLIKLSKADYEAKTPSCRCVLAGWCWSCVTAEVR